jgi:hypothetical protein
VAFLGSFLVVHLFLPKILRRVTKKNDGHLKPGGEDGYTMRRESERGPLLF